MACLLGWAQQRGQPNVVHMITLQGQVLCNASVNTGYIPNGLWDDKAHLGVRCPTCLQLTNEGLLSGGHWLGSQCYSDHPF